MSDHAWELLGQPPPHALAEARLEMHWAVQVAAAVGNTLMEPAPGGAHLALGFEVGSRALVGAAWNGVRVGVRPEDFALYLYDEDLEELEESTLRGRTLAQGLEFLSEMLADAADTELPRPLAIPGYALPEHPVGRGEALGMRTFDTHAELGRWFANGYGLLTGVGAGLDVSEPALCRPDRLDVSVRVPMGSEASPKDARSVRLGLSPGDAEFPGPHLYALVPAISAGVERPPLPVGSWHEGGWTGALLAGEELVAAGDGAAQEVRARAFLDGALGAAEALLGARA